MDKFSTKLNVWVNISKEDLDFFSKEVPKGTKKIVYSKMMEKIVQALREEGLGFLIEGKYDLVRRS